MKSWSTYDILNTPKGKPDYERHRACMDFSTQYVQLGSCNCIIQPQAIGVDNNGVAWGQHKKTAQLSTAGPTLSFGPAS
jgi:hypothetical protein